MELVLIIDSSLVHRIGTDTYLVQCVVVRTAVCICKIVCIPNYVSADFYRTLLMFSACIYTYYS